MKGLLLNVFAAVAPDWLSKQLQPEWVERYGERMDKLVLTVREDAQVTNRKHLQNNHPMD